MFDSNLFSSLVGVYITLVGKTFVGEGGPLVTVD
jgi:hypothetical protein